MYGTNRYANTKVLFALLILLFVVLLVGLVLPNYRLNVYSFMLINKSTIFVKENNAVGVEQYFHIINDQLIYRLKSLYSIEYFHYSKYELK